MSIDKEAVRLKVLELIGAEDEAKRFRASIGERLRRFVVTDTHPDAWEPATFDQIESEVEAGRALDAIAARVNGELEALVNGKPKRKRAKKTKDEKPEPKVRKALGRKGLPKGEAAGGVA